MLIPTLSLIGLTLRITILKRGWTHGAHEIGAVRITVKPLAPGTSLPAFQLTDRGEIERVDATVLAPRQSEKDFQREVRAALGKVLPDVPVELKFEMSGHAKRLYLLLVATTSTGCKLGRDYLYDHRITSLPTAVKVMANQVVSELDAEVKSGACVDEYMADQLVVFQALAKGRSVVNGGKDEEGEWRQRSLHAMTAWWVVQRLLGVSGDEAGGCEGVRFVVGEKFERTYRRVEGVEGTEGIEEAMERVDVT